ncbi:MAG: pyruvate ferredoxin oxidoreductase [Defluviitaleaceae bacterium]|nr:pyruvate ferredoxin oxidoreductase [Defluviitaleaceae bacterium]
MAIRDRLSGNEAVAHALKQIGPDVMAAFPITPSTEIPQYFSAYASNGEVDTEFVAVESEHSALSACVGVAASGGRAVTATSSCGLALMWEMLYVASSMRLPIVLAVVNRALTGPININNDHSDSMGARDSGWIQLYAENNQEVYDNTIMAYRIGEHPDVKLPVMACQDGFITSHGIENIELLESDKVTSFIGTFNPDVRLLNPKHPVSMGPYSNASYYMEWKCQQAYAMKQAKQVILDISKEYANISGREYGLFEEYKMEDAERAIVIIGSSAGTAKATVDSLREKGEKVGLIKIRVFRPFPMDELAKALGHVKAVAVMDKAESFSACGGPLFAETRSACYGIPNAPKMINYVYGLGGRDVHVGCIAHVYSDLEKIIKTGDIGETYRHLSVRE